MFGTPVHQSLWIWALTLARVTAYPHRKTYVRFLGDYMWDPSIYLRYADERSRPFGELLSRIPTTDPIEVVDLGCGPGRLTVSLTVRWPQARVRGLDSSREMIASARALGTDVVFDVADL